MPGKRAALLSRSGLGNRAWEELTQKNDTIRAVAVTNGLIQIYQDNVPCVQVPKPDEISPSRYYSFLLKMNTV